VVETRNGADGFVFSGEGGEVASDRPEDQEAPVRAPHLLRSRLVHVDTPMPQRVPAEPAWRARTTPADARAPTPLVRGRVSPCGASDPDLGRRLALDAPAAA
jgi:hypothetical protein